MFTEFIDGECRNKNWTLVGGGGNRPFSSRCPWTARCKAKRIRIIKYTGVPYFKPGRDEIQGLKTSVAHRYLYCPLSLGGLGLEMSVAVELTLLANSNLTTLHWQEPINGLLTLKCLNIVFKLFSYWRAESIEKVNYQAISSEPKLNYIAKSHSIMHAPDILFHSVISLWTLCSGLSGNLLSPVSFTTKNHAISSHALIRNSFFLPI